MKTYTSPSLAKRCPPTMDPYTYSANVAHPYTPVGMAFNFPVPPAPHISSCAPPPIQRREESEPRVGSHLSKKMRKKCAATSSSSRRRPHRRKAPERRFSCEPCGLKYAQRQGLNRHNRAEHNPSLCISCDFRWSRPHLYRDHLVAHHPELDTDTVMGKTAGSRRKAACFARCAPQEQVFALTTEHGGQGHTEIGSYPPMPLPPVVVKPPTAAPPSMSSITCITQPASAQPTMTNSNPEEERAPAAPGRTMFWSRSAPCQCGGYVGCPPDLVPAHTNPGHTPPVDEYHGSLNPALFQISVAGIDEIWGNAPTFTHAGLGGSGIPY